jgi:hypothetical protein
VAAVGKHLRLSALRPQQCLSCEFAYHIKQQLPGTPGTTSSTPPKIWHWSKIYGYDPAQGLFALHEVSDTPALVYRPRITTNVKIPESAPGAIYLVCV